MQPIFKEGKGAIQKPLCRLCECPTSDGHVLASQVDRFKLRTWAMNVLDLTATDDNLPMLIGEDHLICYFCIWQAEFADEYGDESVAWWPKNLELDENAKVLRENYSAGEVDKCWVQLEEIDLAKYEKEIPLKGNDSGECIYCGNRYKRLIDHVKQKHKHEEAKHMPKIIKCDICDAKFGSKLFMEMHYKLRHTFEKCKSCGEDVALRNKANHGTLLVCSTCKLEFKCFGLKQLHWKSCQKTFRSGEGCGKSFTSRRLLKCHEDLVHNKTNFRCSHCNYYSTSDKSNLTRHMQRRHFPKTAVTKRCKRTPFGCIEFGKTFNVCCQLTLDEQTVPSKTVKTEIFLCAHCDYSTFVKDQMSFHMQRRHFPKRFKCEECNTFYASDFLLKLHKFRHHELVHCAECAQEIRRHTMSSHRNVKICQRCKCKFRCSGLYQLHRKSCKQSQLKECGNSFKSSENTNRHVRQVQTKTVDTEIFICADCGYSTFDKSHMSEHTQRNHLSKTIKCDEG